MLEQIVQIGRSRGIEAVISGLGFAVARHTTVGDDLADITSALTAACGRSRFVVVTGGLGPTDDDLTRHAVAALCGADLVLHRPSLHHVERLISAALVNSRQA